MTTANNGHRFIWQQQSQNALWVCKFRNKMAGRHQLQDEGRDSILTCLEILLNDVTAAIPPDPEPNVIDHIRDCSEALYRCLAAFSVQDPNAYSGYLNQARCLVDIMECSVFDGENNKRVTTTGMPTAGRPKFDISRDQLVYPIEHNFTAVSIAKMFDISLSTVKRRMREQGLSSSQPFSSLTEEELDSIVR